MSQPSRTSPGPSVALVVGLGASAGGLEPLQEFLEHVPAQSGLAFVVVQHLEPRHPSILAELLGRHTAMPVLEAKDGSHADPDHVYVIAPATLLTIAQGVLRVVPTEAAPKSPIDALFQSLAEDQGARAVGVIFSGAGHDGTVGLRMVKQHGGLTVAQAPETAKHDSMLQSAIGAGLVDHVLPVGRMAEKLTEHAKHLTQVAPAGTAADLEEQLAAHLGKICSLIHQRTGHDFSRYKEGTLLRRIRRRLQVQHLTSAEDYLAVLAQDATEAESLLKDLLIGVTQFFRDPDAFQTLAQQIVPRIVQGKVTEAPIRIWVPGCASGEEAYSVAILLREHLERLEARRFVQIFATDLDAEMLAEARHGRYPADIAEQVSPERLARFFVREGQHYQTIKELREMCIFSEHSLIRDPPFSQLDLISCRNVLIYLSAELQKKLVPLFHYALRPGGFLFLGPSEGIAGTPELFEATDKRNRIFRRKEMVIRPMVEFPLSGRGATRVVSGPPLAPLASLPAAPSAQEKTSAAFERVLRDEYTYPSAVINERGDVLFIAGPMNRYLQLPAGAMTTPNLLESFRGSLRQELRTALRTARSDRRKVVRSDIPVEVEDSTRTVRLVVRPMPAVDPEVGLLLVVVQEGISAEQTGEPDVDVGPPALEQLEDELRSTRAELKTTVEELESANEEMKSSNEELISTNEELQSANEEMQTSKEELQSLNEELETVNTELRQKVDELGDANSDLQNLFAATEIATIFLDRSLRVAKFTPAATALFHLLEADVGRPLADFAQRFAGQDLVSDAQEVLRHLTPIARQVRSALGAWFVLRVVPYRTVESLIAGVVVTFVDVTELRRAEEAVRRQGQLVHLSHDAILIWRLEGGIESWNRGAQELYGFSSEEALGRVSQQLLQSTFPRPWPEIKAELLTGGCWAGDIQQRTKEGRTIIVSGNFQLVRGDDGVARVLEANRDITERKRAEEALRQTSERERFLAEVIESATTPFGVGAPDGSLVLFNRAFADLTGYSREELEQRRLTWATDLTPPEWREREAQILAKAVRAGETVRYEKEYFRKDGSRVPIELSVQPVLDRNGSVTHYCSFLADISARKQAEAALVEAHGRTTAILESIADAFYSLDEQWRFTAVNPAAERAPLGRAASELLGKVIWDVFPSIPGTRMHQHYLDAVEKRSREHYEAKSPLNERWYEVFMFPRTGGLDVYLRDITERKRAEQALRESDLRFRLALRNSSVSLAAQDRELKYIWAYNQRTARPEQIIGHRDDEIFTAQEAARLTIIKQRVLDEGLELREQMWLDRPSGRIFLDICWEPIRDEAGRVTGVASATVDLTPIKHAEEALRDSERLLTDVIDGSPMPIFLKDLDGRFLTVNRRLEGLLGLTREQLKGKTDYDISSRDNADIYREHDRQVIESRQPAVVEETAELADGHHVFLNSKFPLVDSAGRVYGVGAISHDITDRKRAEERLRESEQELRDIIDGSPTSIVFLKDLEGRFITVNKRLEDLLGMSREALRGKTDFDIFPPERAEYYREHDRRIVETGEPLLIEEFADLADGKRHTFLASKFPLRDPSGRLYGVGAVSQDITVVKEAEERLRRHLEEVETLMQVAPVAIWVANDAKCHNIIGNQTANAFYEAGEGENVSAGPAPGKPAPPRQFYVNGREVAAVELPMQVAAARNIDVVGSEFDVVLSNGTRRTLSGNASPLRDSEGNVRGCIGAFVDISLRKQAEAALRRFELLASHSRDIVLFMRRADGRILEANAAAQSAYGYSREEMLSLSVSDLRAPDTKQLTDEQMAIADTRGILFETVHQRKDGRTFPVEVSSSGAAIDGTRTLISVVRDITERRHAEEALRQSEKKFRHLADAMPQLVWTAEPDGTVDYFNRRHETLSGARRGDDGTWTWSPVIHPDDLQATLAAWDHAVRTGQNYEMEQRLLLADGAFRWHLARATPIRDESGRVAKWYGTTTDIHELKEVQRALTDVDRSKNDFLAMLSHELRNPLAPIRNSAYILARAAPGGEQARRALAVIDRQAGQLARLVDDLLDVTRFTRNKIQLQCQTLELNELVRHTMEDQRSLFEKAEVHLKLHPAPNPVIVNADRNRLAQVVSNLLQNAAKFTGRGGTTSITIRVDAAAKRAVIQVTDTGVGMAPEMVSRLFQPFSQAESSLDRSQGGLGLGLALAKGLVELHGGDVEARSAGLGKGAEFAVRLPLAMEEAVALQLSPKATTSRRRVLIIEDNIDAADSLCVALELNGHQVEVAYSGPDGLDRARDLYPDVVLCDIGLPGMDGYGVARAFRADDALRGVFLVALSGYALPEDMQCAQEAGFDAHLAKPPSLEKLEELLASAPGSPSGPKRDEE